RSSNESSTTCGPSSIVPIESILTRRTSRTACASPVPSRGSCSHGAARRAGASWRFWQQRGGLPEARARLERMLARPEAQGRDAVRARALGAYGSIVYWQGDQEHVLAPYQEA